MPFSKPLHTPKAHHRDRPAGRRLERLRETLVEPARSWRSDEVRFGRSAHAKRHAYTRFTARTGSDRGWRGTVLALALFGMGAALLGGMTRSGNLVTYHDAPEAYDALAAYASASCAEGRCVFGWPDRRDVPDDLKVLMVRTRARFVEHDPSVGETLIQRSSRAAFVLLHRAEPTAHQARTRRLRRASVAAYYGQTSFRAPELVDLGGGWVRRMRR